MARKLSTGPTPAERAVRVVSALFHDVENVAWFELFEAGEEGPEVVECVAFRCAELASTILRALAQTTGMDPERALQQLGINASEAGGK